MQSVIQMVTAVLSGVGQVVGIRSSIEEPRYNIEAKLGDIEIRRYEERLAAETEVEGTAETARVDAPEAGAGGASLPKETAT